ncbi:MAG: GntR family transcriptional regulator [Azoarcus sp.]|nr:GntR family transcriptional regulator [Azoarcus sp.]
MARKRSSIDLGAVQGDEGMSVNGRDEAIYRNLFAAIVENHLEPGTKLPEDTLAEAFAVSRTSIRKVLQRLAYERLVDIRLNRGATVAQPTVKEARDVFAARRIVECGVVAQVVAKATPARLDELRAIVRREHEAEARGDRREAIYLSGEFHVALSRLSENEAISEILAGLVSRSSLVIATFGSPMAGSCRHSEHDDVLDLIAAGDVEATRAWMERHLREVERSVVLVEEAPSAPDLRRILDEVAERHRRSH